MYIMISPPGTFIKAILEDLEKQWTTRKLGGTFFRKETPALLK